MGVYPLVISINMHEIPTIYFPHFKNLHIIRGQIEVHTCGNYDLFQTRPIECHGYWILQREVMLGIILVHVKDSFHRKCMIRS